MNSFHERLTMRRLPTDDRPYEKMMGSGPQALTDAELMAIIIRSGSQKDTALALCQKLLAADPQPLTLRLTDRMASSAGRCWVQRLSTFRMLSRSF